jgi:4'-phosphopantetheinyl transferase
MPGMPAPSHDAVMVSWLDPRDLPARAYRMLSAEERMQANAGGDPHGRRQRAAAGVLLRCAVSSVVGCTPRELPVIRRCPHCATAHGRPELPGSPLRVSVSHAGDRVMVAVSACRPVGVDVEAPRARPLSRALLRRALTRREQAHLRSLPESRQAPEFLRAWTAKEAILKATGEGLHGGPNRLDLDLRSTPVRLLSWAGSATRVRLVELATGDGHVATLATIGDEAPSVACHEGRALVQRMAS